MAFNVKNGTPLHASSLCETCMYAFSAKGYRASEELVICQRTYPEHVVRFQVRDCSGYVEVKRQTLKQMEDIAWVLQPRGSKRQAGFISPSERNDDGSEIELILNGNE